MANNEIPVLESKERIDANTQPQPFGQAYRSLGASTNVLSSMGSEIALNASIARAEMDGLQLGKTPKGDLMPAITKTDEAFTNAYRNQAMATLSLEGEKLLTNSLQTINEAGKLTPQILDDFNNNMLIGLEEIAQNAPSIDRDKLQHNFSAQLLSAQAKLNTKLIAQQREDELDTFNAHLQQSGMDIFDLSVGRDFDSAKIIFEQIKTQNEEMASSGFITQVQSQKNINSARINLLTGRTYADAMAADDNNKLDEFLSDYGKNKPSDMTNSEWVEVGSQVMKLVSYKDSTDSRHQATLVAEGSKRIQMHMVDNEFLSRARDEMTKANYDNFIASFYKYQRKNKAKEDRVNFVLSNWRNPGELANESDKDLNTTFDMIAANTAKTQELDLFDAEVITASDAVVPIPKFTKKLNALAQSGLPDSIESASLAIQSIAESRPGNLNGVNKDSRALITAYEEYKEGGIDNILAAQLATKDVLGIDDQERNARKEEWTRLSKELFGKNKKDLVKNSLKLAGVKNYNIPDPVRFALKYKNDLEDAYYITGNINTAQRHVEKQFDESYGLSSINVNPKNRKRGKEYVYAPIERIMDIAPGTEYMIYSQIEEQAQIQMDRFNSLPEKDRPFRYEFSEQTPSISQEEYNSAKEKLGNLLLQAIEGTISSGKMTSHGREIKENQNIVEAYENPQRRVLKRIYTDGSEQEFYLGIYAQTSANSTDGVPVYDLKLINENGEIENFLNVDGFNRRRSIYIPNPEAYQSRLLEELNQSKDGGSNAIKQMRKEINDTVQYRKDIQEKASATIQRARETGSWKEPSGIWKMIETMDEDISSILNRVDPKIQEGYKAPANYKAPGKYKPSNNYKAPNNYVSPEEKKSKEPSVSTRRASIDRAAEQLESIVSSNETLSRSEIKSLKEKVPNIFDEDNLRQTAEKFNMSLSEIKKLIGLSK